MPGAFIFLMFLFFIIEVGPARRQPQYIPTSRKDTAA